MPLFIRPAGHVCGWRRSSAVASGTNDPELVFRQYLSTGLCTRVNKSFTQSVKSLKSDLTNLYLRAVLQWLSLLYTCFEIAKSGLIHPLSAQQENVVHINDTWSKASRLA